jgi:hypothetical protein
MSFVVFFSLHCDALLPPLSLDVSQTTLATIFRFNNSVWHGGHTTRRFRLLAVALVVKHGGNISTMQVYHRSFGPCNEQETARLTQHDYFTNLDDKTEVEIASNLALRELERNNMF